MAFFNKDTAAVQNKHAKKLAWNSFINGGGNFNATVFYWLKELPAQDRAELKSAMLNYQGMDTTQGESE